MDLRAIFRDETLFGHALTSAPEKMWEFSQGDFSFYHRPDPGTRVVEADYLIAQKVHFRTGNGVMHTTEFCIDLEFVVRRILAPCAAAASLFLLAPLGFTAKVVHICIRQKVQQIWEDPTLFGHAFTSTPGKLAQLTVAPLQWHLRADGTDRRHCIGTSEPPVIRQSEYELVPFELFEVAYRGLTGAATLVAGALSPLGLAAKAVHLASRNILETYG